MAIPPSMNLNDAIDVMLDMEKQNTDGFGFAFARNGKIIHHKSKLSLTKCIQSGDNRNITRFLPKKREGWIILHIRNATHGKISARNSHPFLAGDYAMVHNGTLKNDKLVRAAMGKIDYSSETDSEVGLHLFLRIGLRKFTELVDNSGVFFFLKKDGSLAVSKTAYIADLKVVQLPNKDVFLVSELKYNNEFKNKEELPDGYFLFDKKGAFIKGQEKDKKGKFKIKFDNTIDNVTPVNVADDLSSGSFFHYKNRNLHLQKQTCIVNNSPFRSSNQQRTIQTHYESQDIYLNHCD